MFGTVYDVSADGVENIVLGMTEYSDLDLAVEVKERCGCSVAV